MTILEEFQLAAKLVSDSRLPASDEIAQLILSAASSLEVHEQGWAATGATAAEMAVKAEVAFLYEIALARALIDELPKRNHNG